MPTTEKHCPICDTTTLFYRGHCLECLVDAKELREDRLAWSRTKRGLLILVVLAGIGLGIAASNYFLAADFSWDDVERIIYSFGSVIGVAGGGVVAGKLLNQKAPRRNTPRSNDDSSSFIE